MSNLTFGAMWFTAWAAGSFTYAYNNTKKMQRIPRDDYAWSRVRVSRNFDVFSGFLFLVLACQS